MTFLAAALAAVAVISWRPPGRWWVRRRLGSAGPSRRWWIAAALPVGALTVSLIPRFSAQRVVLAAIAGAVAAFVLHQLRAARERQRIAARHREVMELVALMAAELRAGVLPSRLLTGLADDFAVLVPAARAAELGGDVAGALREASQVRGREVLRDLGGAWHVAERAGAPLSAVLTRVAQAVRIEQDIARETQAGVAPARATGRLMAVLPAFGLLLGSGMGGDPVDVLIGSWIGLGCLAAGCALACLGVVWIERIAASAMSS